MKNYPNQTQRQSYCDGDGRSAKTAKTITKELLENYSDFLDKNKTTLKVGFICSVDKNTDWSPITASIKDTITLRATCRNFDVEVKAYLGRVPFGEFDVQGVWTSKVEIAHKLPAHGFGSHCHVDEAKTMEEAIVEMCKKHNLMICESKCSWPMAVAVVQPNKKQ